MISLKEALSSSVGRKWITTLTGIGLIGFAVAHLVGNLTLIPTSSVPFNTYAAKLDSLGPLKLVAEFGLLILFGLHILNSIALKKNHLDARPVGYRVWKSKDTKEATPSNFSSRNMALSGIFLMGMILIHIKHFTLGPSIEAGYITDLNGHQVRDLHRLVVEQFGNPLIIVAYMAFISFLAMHLRHGVWSTLQSFGLVTAKTSKSMYALLVSAALLLAAGFLFLPLWIYISHHMMG